MRSRRLGKMLSVKNRIRLVAAATAVLMAVVDFPVSVFATSDTSDTREQLEEAEQEMEEAQQELEEAQGRLQETQNNLAALEDVQDTYQGQMQILNEELTLVADNLAVIETEIQIKEIEILETTLALEEAERIREEQYTSMQERIRFLYERGDTVYMEMLFSARSFGEFLNYADYIEQLSAYDRRMLEEYIANEELIAQQRALLEEEMLALEELRAEAQEEQGRVNGLITATATNIATTADTIAGVEAAAAAYEAECDQRQAEAEAAQAEYEEILAQYQEELRLSQLAAQSEWRDISQVVFEENDRYLLANLIYCEAGGESYEGQLAVGAVVINRLLSSRYPNTVTGVIYQRKQFSPVLDGHLAAALAQNKATESCYRAADEAMRGVTNVGNCLYFRTPIEGLTGIQIGGHIFY